MTANLLEIQQGHEDRRLFPSGISHNYIHSSPYHLKRVEAKSRSNQLMGNFEKHTDTHFTSSRGGFVKYDFQGGLLTKVDRKQKPSISYEYSKEDPYFKEQFLIKKNYPEGRFLEIAYMQWQNNLYHLRDESTYTVAPEHHRKVRYLRRPYPGKATGDSKRFISTYAFEYFSDGTLVKNACGELQEFHFDKEKRLTKVISKAYDKEIIRGYIWGNDQEEGYLKAQYASDGKNTLFCKRFDYDKRGNVIAEHFHGDLTGRGTPWSIDFKSENLDKLREQKELEEKLDRWRELFGDIVDKQKKDDSENQTILSVKGYKGEVTTNRYEYSQDSYNNLLKEIRRDGLEIRYTYEPNSNRLVSKFECKGNLIQKRTFHSYDDFSNIICLIEDDVSTEHPEDLTDVHVRKITRRCAYETGPSIGLIKEEQSIYWDADQQQEIELFTKAYTYNLAGDVTSITTQLPGYDDATIIFEYDDHHNITLEKHPNGAIITRQYDLNNNKTLECGPDPQVKTIFTYDLANNLIKKEEVHPDGSYITQYKYNGMSRLIEEKSPYNISRTISYDGFGRPSSLTITQSLDPFGQPTQTKASKNAREYFEYDTYGRITQKKDALGYLEKYAYNSLDALIFEHKPGKVSANHYYDLNGLKTETVLGTGAKDIYTYDTLGRMIKLHRFNNQNELILSQTFTYQGLLLTEIVDNLGRKEAMNYDGAGRVIKKTVSDLTGVLQEEAWTYDGLDRIIQHRQYSNSTDYIDEIVDYDAMGKVKEKKFITVDGIILGHELFEYDFTGHVIRETKLTEGKLEEKYSEYNSHGHLIKLTDGLGYTWSYEYDYAASSPFGGVKLDRVIEYRPDGSHKVDWKTHDQLTIDSSIYAADGSLAYAAHYGYNPYGGCTYRSERTLSSGTDIAEEVVTLVEFGPSNLVLQRIDGYGSNFERIRKWTYDVFGRVTSYTMPSGIQINYGYNSLGLLTRVYSSDKSIDQSFRYDAYGQPTEIMQTDGMITRRRYNGIGQVIYDNPGHGLAVEKTYDYVGRVLTTTLPLGVQITRQYEHAKLQSIEMTGSLGSYSHQYLEYDDQGRILRESMVGGAGEITRSYDLLGRVTSVNTDYFKSSIPENGFDSMGRLVTLTRGFENQGTQHFTYDALGQLLSESKEGSKTVYDYNSRGQRLAKDNSEYQNNLLGELEQVGGSINPSTFEYDLDGRLIKCNGPQGKMIMSYDAFNRLVQIATSNKVINYYYDGFDRRLWKNTFINGEIAHEQGFVYDDQFELGMIEYDDWKEFRLIGLRSQAETGDTLLVMVDHRAYATILDLQGSIVGWVDVNTHELAARCEYDAYGLATGEVIGPWGYVAKRLDPETGWIFYGKRYYLPSYGRWLTQDPKGEIDGSNLYGFLRNNPVYQKDLWGFNVEEIGTLGPLFYGDTSNPQVLRFKTIIQETFHENSLESCKKRYNARIITCVVDPNKPWIYIINGINNREWECVARVCDWAKKSGFNVISVYHASMGLYKDVNELKKRTLTGYDPYRVEYPMIGKMFDIGLKFNRELGINNFDGVGHSKGEDAGIHGLIYMKKSDIQYISMLGVGGVGDHALIPKLFINHKCYVDTHDYIAQTGRVNVDSRRVEYGNYSVGFNRHNFDDGYWGTAWKYIQTMYQDYTWKRD